MRPPASAQTARYAAGSALSCESRAARWLRDTCTWRANVARNGPRTGCADQWPALAGNLIQPPGGAGAVAHAGHLVRFHEQVRLGLVECPQVFTGLE